MTVLTSFFLSGIPVLTWT